MPNPQSTASIAGHPLHPMLIPFPIAFFVATFVCDLVFWRTGDSFWATGALWLLGAGLVMAALAAVIGLIDVLGEERIRALNDTWWHAGGNVTAVLIALYNWYLRYTSGEAAVVPPPASYCHWLLFASFCSRDGKVGISSIATELVSQTDRC